MKTYHDIAHDGGSNVAGQVAERDERMFANLSEVRHIVAVMSGKGGVGKSAVTTNLATELAMRGMRTGIVDADINGASVAQMTGVPRTLPTTAHGVRPPVSEVGVKVMSIDLFLPDGKPVKWAAHTQQHAYAWRGMAEVNAIREMLADTVWGPLDVLLIDLPPGTDKLPNLFDTVSRLSAAVVVSIPSPASRYVVRKSVTLAQEALGNRPLGLVENMATFVCTDCGKEHVLYASDPLDMPGVLSLGQIPFDPDFGSLLDAGRPQRALSDGGPAAQGVAAVADNLLALLETVSEPISQ
ncbi:MAG: P-loop NTPase [Rhodothermales bacterium]|nr:P-loop NTPase [Rhodothermales bacterium]MBO6778139.1 P-loop NTPase [Rhodothermales bacterium]